MKCLNVFPKERTIVQRERAKSSYGVAPYFLSKLAAESPIGAFFPLLFASIVYPAAGLHPKLSRCFFRHPATALLACVVLAIVSTHAWDARG